VSRKGAEELGFLGRGTARVRVRYVGPAPLAGANRLASASLDDNLTTPGS